MAANFWASSHFNSWIFTKEQLVQSGHKKDKVETKLGEDEIRRVMVHYSIQIQALGKKLSLRQRAIATAIVYFRRFYFKNNFIEFCPRLIAPTCLYISSKAEECSTQVPAYRFEKEMKKQDSGWPYTSNNIIECEFYVIEALDFHLVVFHPYRSLIEYLTDCKLEKELLETSWNLVNDTYCTDLSLLFPPYIIALACIYVASLTAGEVDLRLWLASLNVKMKDIWLAANELLEFYDTWKKEQPDALNEVLGKLPTFPNYNNSNVIAPAKTYP